MTKGYVFAVFVQQRLWLKERTKVLDATCDLSLVCAPFFDRAAPFSASLALTDRSAEKSDRGLRCPFPPTLAEPFRIDREDQAVLATWTLLLCCVLTGEDAALELFFLIRELQCLRSIDAMSARIDI